MTDSCLLAALAEHQLLLLADRHLPSVAAIVAGEPISGSWWGHPAAHEIFRAANALGDQPDALVCKLLSGKVTFVHRSTWPDVLAIATSRAPWQIVDLTADAMALLSQIEDRGQVRAAGYSARELEKRFLVHASDVHTDRGSHAKVLETWQPWVDAARPLPDPGAAQQRLAGLVHGLNRRYGGSAHLPWQSTRV